MQVNAIVEKCRIDKWLLAARFFKTRSLASGAIELGRVTLNGRRTKPAKLVVVGDVLTIRMGSYQYTIEILELSDRRGSATQAQKLYNETHESREQREVMAVRLKAHSQSFLTRGRPTKRDRREIERLISSQDQF